MKNKEILKGFTLLELMVSIALMLILVGAVIDVFHNTSEVFNRAQAKMFIYANARALFKNLENDISAAIYNQISGKTFEINNNNSGSTSTFMSFKTYTSWRDKDLNFKKGEAQIELILEEVTGKDYYQLYRKVNGDGDTKALLVEYIPIDKDGKASIKAEGIKFKSDTNTWEIGDFSQPDGLRITLVLTDKYKREYRIFSKIFWIAKN